MKCLHMQTNLWQIFDPSPILITKLLRVRSTLLRLKGILMFILKVFLRRLTCKYFAFHYFCQRCSLVSKITFEIIIIKWNNIRLINVFVAIIFIFVFSYSYFTVLKRKLSLERDVYKRQVQVHVGRVYRVFVLFCLMF